MRGLVGETIQDLLICEAIIDLRLQSEVYIVMMVIIINNNTDNDIRGDKTMITIDRFGNKDGFYCD